MLAAVAGGLGTPAIAQSPSLDEVLLRAGEYVEDLEQRLSTVVAEEEYVQRDQTPPRRNSAAGGLRSPIRSRRLRSDMLMVRPPGSTQWLQFRDVFEVDGVPVRDRDDRLATLFLSPSRSSFEQASAILAESARYNIGVVQRTINIPVLALVVLNPAYQSRFRFTRANPGNLEALVGLAAPADIWAVDYQETDPDTMIRGRDDRAMPARGRLWIDAPTGRVLRSELAVDDGQMRGRITVSYQTEPALGFLVPAEMREEHTGADGTRLLATATYSRFRRFAVVVEETVKPPDQR